MTEALELKIVTPTGIVLAEPVSKVVAEAPNGSFGILPRHIDFVSELVAGVLIFVTRAGVERFVGVNQGTLVKRGGDILVATHDAILGDDLATLERRVAETFLQIDEHERVARSALARLEAGIVRRFIDLERGPE